MTDRQNGADGAVSATETDADSHGVPELTAADLADMREWMASADGGPPTAVEPVPAPRRPPAYDPALVMEGPESSTPVTTSSADASGPALEFVTFAELAAQVDAEGPRKWLLRGVWPAGDYGVHAAEAKAQKTWNTVDLAVAVASGTPWLGSIPVDVQGPVLMFVGEGGRANLVRRVRAVAESRGLDADTLPIVVCARAPHLSNVQHMREFAAKVERLRPVLVTLDPLYLAAKGADRGDLFSMGAMLETVQRVCQRFAASLWVVHHYNRTAGSGASRISGAGPAEWGRVLITAEVKSRRVVDLATRETDVVTALDVLGGEVPDRTIRLRRRIWADDPDDLDSPLHVVSEVSEGEEDGAGREFAGHLTPADRKVIAALSAISAGGQPAIGDWIANKYGNGLKRETLSRCLGKLEKLHIAESVNGGPFKAALWSLAPDFEPNIDADNEASGPAP